MNNDTAKIAAFYDQMGRDLFHKVAQDINTSTDSDAETEFGTGGKLRLSSLVKKLMKKEKK